MTSTPSSTRLRDPLVIQGGTAVATSSWRPASGIARAGQLGVVSGTAVDLTLARRLQDGDPDGSVRRALAAFPAPQVAARVLDRYFRDAGRGPDEPYDPIPRLALRQKPEAQELLVLGAFVEVWLAKDGAVGPVGIDILASIRMASPTTLYGAMLAGADHVLVTGEVPRRFPVLIDRLVRHRAVSLPVPVEGDPEAGHSITLDPAALLGVDLAPLPRPRLLAVLSPAEVPEVLDMDPDDRPDGLVLEGETDEGIRLALAEADLPYWLAGTAGTPEALAAARASGAAGIRVESLASLSSDSDLVPELRARLLGLLRAGDLEVRADHRVSPTGTPFTVAQVPGTLSEPELAAARPRLCDLGYLRTPFLNERGSVGYRCSAEPEHVAERKGVAAAEISGRGCLCNSLVAAIGLAQVRADGYVEQPLVTLGLDLDGAHRLVEVYPDGWTAAQAVAWLVAGIDHPIG